MAKSKKKKSSTNSSKTAKALNSKKSTKVIKKVVKSSQPSRKAGMKAKSASAKAKKVAKKTHADHSKKSVVSKKTASAKFSAANSSTKISTKNKKFNFSGFLTPLDDRLLVQLIEGERRTAGGLYLPDTVADASGNIRGEVVSVGRGRRDKKGKIHPMDVVLGDQIVFSQYSGNKINLMGQDLVILHEAEVMGIVTK